eukprot:733957-Prorocentrum_lima.AAC.1
MVVVAPGHHLLADLHGELLRLVAAQSGMHFAGLQVAATRLRGKLSPQVCKKLRQVDVLSLIHISEPTRLDVI